MSTGYVPNEKRLKMFGAQAQGYAMDRVDMYLDKLEGAYTQLRTAYEQMKVTATDANSAQPAPAANPAQMQELLAINARLQQDAQALHGENEALRAKIVEVEARIARQLSTTASQPPPNHEGSIARALLAAQEKAEEILRGSQLEAQGIIANAHNQVEHLKAERSRAIKQLEGIRYTLDSILRDPQSFEGKQNPGTSFSLA
ncbi:MAG: DivIVA domain-containing protein [Oscillospiraceae bacterium]|jgi:cell division septum initiation protein DivIVA|nr:DivIVA domain-containing protein [Oscillospiraceae bacterium]